MLDAAAGAAAARELLALPLGEQHPHRGRAWRGGRGAFTHTSWNDHEIVVANLLDDDPRRIADRIAWYALFIDPPLDRVGRARDAGDGYGFAVGYCASG